MNALSAIDWNGVLNSVLRSMLGFSAIYVSYFIARRLVEFSRKDEGSRGFWRIIKVCGVAAIALLLIGWFFWADVSGGSVDSETGEETPITPPRAAHNFAAKIVLTLLLPVMIGIYRGFRTPHRDIQKIPEPRGYDYDEW